MEENYLKYKNEQLDIKTELATEKDWEAYKELRLLVHHLFTLLNHLVLKK